MSLPNQQKDNLITQLLRSTLSNNIQWKITDAPKSLTHATENYVSRFFETTFNGTRIGIYEYRYRYFTDYDQFHWSESLGICIIHEPDSVVWKIEEYSPSLRDLFQIASEQASGLDSLLNL